MLAEPRTLIDELLTEQGAMTAVERFSQTHSRGLIGTSRYRELLTKARSSEGRQYAFEVDLDQCSGCKACVTACHSLNGLHPGETWRDVGHLISHEGTRPFQQAVTTACHHCLDPECLNGCPVRAYEKDPLTGIVHHLDDQCIGCQYCVLKCPYDVPKYSERLGIVRKCDMCSQRLELGEAPACVQACPNEAIQIELVERKEIVRSLNRETQAFLPGSPDPRITWPTTQYRSARGLPERLVAINVSEVKLQPAHWPLIWMLVLTQFGVGAWCAGLAASEAVRDRILSVALGVAGLGLIASVAHLGQPMKAWRSFLGWKTSWMSREIIGFSAFFPLALLSLLGPLLGLLAPSAAQAMRLLAGIIGLITVLCSGMVYHDTQRPTWKGWRSLGRFLMTTALLGSMGVMVACVWLGIPAGTWLGFVIPAAGLKLLCECFWLWPSAVQRRESGEDKALSLSAQLQWSALRGVTVGRLSVLAAGGVLFPGLFSANPTLGWAALCLCLCVGSELAERYSFFRTMVARRMPGV